MTGVPKRFEPAAYVDVMFFEEVRQEHNGKNFFIGVYGPSMIVPMLPHVARPLVARMVFTTNAENSPHSLRFVLHKGDEVLREAIVPEEDLSNAKSERAKTKSKAEKDAFLRITTFLDLSGMEISAPGKISSFVEADGRAYRGTSLDVMDEVSAKAKGLLVEVPQPSSVEPGDTDAESAPAKRALKKSAPKKKH